MPNWYGKGGKNILRLSANVYYAKKILFFDMAPVEPEPIPKPDILSQPSSFPEPGPPPDWTHEKEVLKKAERLQAERRLKEEQEEAERQWQEALELEQTKVDADFEKRKIASEAEFKSWGRPEQYEVFKGQKVYVTVDIKEVSSSAFDRWVKRINSTGSSHEKDNRSPEQEELIRLRKENQRLLMENDVLKQVALIFAQK